MIESWKYDAQRSIFDEIRGVWIADETLSRVVNIAENRNKMDPRNGEIEFYEAYWPNEQFLVFEY